MEQSQTGVITAGEEPKVAPASEQHSGSCPACQCGDSSAAAPPSYVYAIGRIAPRFPRADVEKEFAQVAGRGDTKGLTDPQVLHRVLSQRQNRYLVRKLCWVMSVQGLETYLLSPRDPADFDLLVESLRPTPRPEDLDVAIGLRGPVASPAMCNGLTVPVVLFDQIYSFDRSSLLGALPKKGDGKGKGPGEGAGPAAEVVLDRVLQMTDNAGATSEHRALNYLAMREPRIYQAVADAYGRGESLTCVDVRPSPLSGTRNIVEVIFSFTNRETNVVQKQFARVDVTEEFPFLVSVLAPYYDLYWPLRRQ